MAIQKEFPGMEQERIRTLENAADKFDAARQLVQASTADMNNAEFKLMEEMFAAVAAKKIKAETDALGAVTITYHRGDYKLVTKGGKMHAKVKIKQASKPPAADSLNPKDEAAA